MGTYYHVTLEAYHDWDRTQAIRRCQMHGHPLDSIHAFFSQFPEDNEWTEVQLCIVLTDFQSALYEDPGFLLRVLEESIWYDDATKSPLREHYPTLWDEFAITEDNPSVLWIMAETFHEGEKVWAGGDSFDEALEARIIYPARFTPDLHASTTDWEGCGWYTDDKQHLQEHLHYGLRHTECRLLKRDLVFWRSEDGTAQLQTPKDHDAIQSPDFAMHQAAPLQWGDVIGLHTANGCRQLTNAGELTPWSPPEGQPTSCSSALWSLTDERLLLHRPTGTATYPKPTLKDPETPLPPWRVILTSDGSPAVIGPKQIARWQSKKWTVTKHPETHISSAVCGSDDVLWFARGSSLYSFDVAGQLTPYDQQSGLMGSIYHLIPLPHGVVWLITSERFNKLQQVHTGASRIHPPKGMYERVPEHIAGGALGPDGDLWLLTQYSHLLQLQEGALPRYYAFDEIMPRAQASRWHEPDIAMHISPNGALFCRRGDVGYWIAADTIAACAQQPSINDELFLPGQREVFSFPRPDRTERLDLQGKRFHFVGKLDTMTQKQASSLLSTYGASYSSSLSKHVTHVVRGTNTQQYAMNWQKRRSFWEKIAQAEKLLKPVLSEAEFLRLLAHAQQAP